MDPAMFGAARSSSLMASSDSSFCCDCLEVSAMHNPVMPVRAIISTENMESRASVGFCSPVIMVLPMRASSITITDPVSTRVP